ncbi:MAG: hypothetical protein ACLP8X_33120 [Streptosporangiaceae bacterium]
MPSIDLPSGTPIDGALALVTGGNRGFGRAVVDELPERTVVTALHVAFMDTDMTAGLNAPKADPRDIARRTADAIIAGDFEVLADDTTRAVKSQLSQDVTALYTQLTVA